MIPLAPIRRALLLTAAMLTLGLCGCGAGLIGGVVAGGASDPAPTPTPIPTLTATNQTLPLSPPLGETLASVVVNNASISSVQNLSVELRARGRSEPQRSPFVSGGAAASGAVTISYTLQLGSIVEGLDLTAGDVSAEIAVLDGGAEVADPVPVTLVRQPSASLSTRRSPQKPLARPFLQSAGGSRVALFVEGLQPDPTAELQMLVFTQTSSVRSVPVDSVEPAPSGAGQIVRALVPGNSIPEVALLAVSGPRSGLSTPVTTAYAPTINGIFPPAGDVDGGEVVTLIGSALVPVEPNPSGLFDLDKVTLLFTKAGRQFELPPGEIRQGTANQLVFRMPRSLDGLPGPVRVTVRVELEDGTTVEDSVADSFTYGYQQLIHGPRGVALDERPVDIVSASILDGSRAVGDVALLTEQAGLGALQTLGGIGNGMFRPIGPARLAGSAGDASQRNPRDLVASDLDGDGSADLLMVNAGAGNQGRHLFVPGQQPPEQPLGAPFAAGATASGMRLALDGDFDGDGVVDFVMIPAADAADLRPEVVRGAVSDRYRLGAGERLALPSPAVAWEHGHLDDLDGDGNLDCLLARGGENAELVVALGDGRGTLAVHQLLALVPAGLALHPDMSVVGLHPLANGDLAVVWSGSEVAGLPPAIQVLTAGSPATYGQPAGAVVQLGQVARLVDSLSADLSGNGEVEIVLALGGSVPAPVRLFERRGTGYAEVIGGVEGGGERMENVSDLQVVRVLGGLGVAVSHSVRIDGVVENRLSTMLATRDPVLRSADPSIDVQGAIVGLVTGEFGAFSADVLAVTNGTLLPFENDGFGTLAPSQTREFPIADLVPTSVRRIKLSRPGGPPGDSVFWLLDGAAGLRIGMFRPLEPELFESADLRSLLPPSVANLPLGVSPTHVADVDGDGLEDVVVLLRYPINDPGEGDGFLLLFRGRPVASQSEFPLELPVAVTPTHGLASDIVFGDLATGNNSLEAAVTVPSSSLNDPTDGNHVRFYHLEDGALRRSGGTASLIAGSGPSRVAVADLDDNGREDIVVAGADGRLRTFLSTGMPSRIQGEVDVSTFFESSSSPQLLPPGEPTQLVRTDFNGDGIADFLASVEERDPVTNIRSTTLALYLTRGLGGLDGPRCLSDTRTGNRVNGVLRDRRASVAVADLNFDDLPDVVVGWQVAGAVDRNLRVLLAQGR